MKGAKIGKGVSFGIFSTIDADYIEIGDYSKIGILVQIKARKFSMGAYSQIKMMTVINAPRVKIGNETIIMEQVIIGGMQTQDSIIKIGDRCKIFQFTFINPTRPVIIGNDVGIGGSNYLFTHGSWSNSLEGFPIDFGPIRLEDRVWLPWRIFILPNVTIGHDSVIGAGSVVSKSIPPLSLAAGVPAKVKRSGDDFIKKPTLEEKVERLKSMFSGFEDYLNICGLSVEKDANANEIESEIWSGSIRSRSNNLGFVYVLKSLSDNLTGILSKNVHCVSLEPISQAIREQIVNLEGAWFDLHDYEWGGKRERLTQELRTYLSTFGVRLESVDLR